MTVPLSASIIIPTFNGANKIAGCLNALIPQIQSRSVEILVVDDGSSDSIADAVGNWQEVRLIRQKNAGPAAARNRGVGEAVGEIVLFTDDDCVPAPNWLDAMLAPFEDPLLIGAKGTYKTQQRQLTARFVQAEYEDKYRLMASQSSIDFVDTYSAAFRREKFLEIGGYDTSFPVACAEDVELSYRMSAQGWLMRFIPDAVVFHTHPDRPSSYLKKKYKFAFWRIYAVQKNAGKAVRDSHTPQLMKVQLLLLPALLLAGMSDLWTHERAFHTGIVLGFFLLSTLPFSVRTFVKDPMVGLLAPIFLTFRSFAQFLGVSGGTMYCYRKRTTVATSAGRIP